MVASPKLVKAQNVVADGDEITNINIDFGDGKTKERMKRANDLVQALIADK